MKRIVTVFAFMVLISVVVSSLAIAEKHESVVYKKESKEKTEADTDETGEKVKEQIKAVREQATSKKPKDHPAH